MKKKPSLPKSFPLRIYAIILVIFVVIGLFYYQKQQTAYTSIPLDCSDAKSLTTALTKDIKKENLYLQEQSYSTSFLIKRNSSEPYITYPGYSVLIMLRHEGKKDTSILQNNFIQMLGKQSFTKDETRGIYTKGDYMYKITTDSEWVIFSKLYGQNEESPAHGADPNDQDAEEVNNIHISCGVKDKEFDAMYDELLPLDEVKQRLIHFNPIIINETTKAESVFGIKKIHKNNIVETAVFGTVGGGGYTLWLQKTANGWERIYSGQQSIDCKLLEDRGIESGVECTDSSLEEGCDVKIKGTACYLRKTK